jgi:hypothetical protein
MMPMLRDTILYNFPCQNNQHIAIDGQLQFGAFYKSSDLFLNTLSLNGSSAFASVTGITPFTNGNEYTVSFWINIPAFGVSANDKPILTRAGTVGQPLSSNFAFWWNSSENLLSFGYNNGSTLSTRRRVNIPLSVISNNTWYHIAGVIQSLNSGNDIKLSIFGNGILVAQQTFSGGPYPSSNHDIFGIGVNQSGEVSPFDIADLRIYGIAVNPNVIRQMSFPDSIWDLYAPENKATTIYAFNTDTNIETLGIPSAEAFGNFSRLNMTIQTTGIPSAAAFGTPNGILLPTGIASAAAFGTPKLNMSIRMTGIASANAFGSTSVNLQLQNIFPTGIAGGTVGTPTVFAALHPTGIASSSAMGNPTVIRTNTITFVGGSRVGGTSTVKVTRNVIASSGARAAGSGLPSFAVKPTGIAGGTVGTPQLNMSIKMTGIASAAGFGATSVQKVALPTGIASAAAFGTPTLNMSIQTTGIASGETFGSPTVIRANNISNNDGAIAGGTASITSYVYQTTSGGGRAGGSANENLYKSFSYVATGGVTLSGIFGGVYGPAYTMTGGVTLAGDADYRIIFRNDESIERGDVRMSGLAEFHVVYNDETCGEDVLPCMGSDPSNNKYVRCQTEIVFNVQWSPQMLKSDPNSKAILPAITICRQGPFLPTT